MRMTRLEGYEGGRLPLGGSAALAGGYLAVFAAFRALLARWGRARPLAPGVAGMAR